MCESRHSLIFSNFKKFKSELKNANCSNNKTHGNHQCPCSIYRCYRDAQQVNNLCKQTCGFTLTFLSIIITDRNIVLILLLILVLKQKGWTISYSKVKFGSPRKQY